MHFINLFTKSYYDEILQSMLWILIVIALVLAPLTAPTASANSPEFSNCLLPNPRLLASDYDYDLKLATPLAPERAGNKSKIQIGVIPFYFANATVPSSTSVNATTYRGAVSFVESLSKNIVDISLTFFPIIKTKVSSAEFPQTEIYTNQLIKDADKVINFSNLDILVFENKSESVGSASVAAFVGRTFQTDEGSISNVVVLSENYHPEVIAHEFLHAFGLVDLYPSDSELRQFSMMHNSSRNSGARLLNYEKAVLGWLPLKNIQCKSFSNLSSQDLRNNLISIEDLREDQLFIFKLSDDEALILEIQNGNLLTYLLNNTQRPPVRLIERVGLGGPSSVMSLTYERNVSEVFVPANITGALLSNQALNFEIIYLEKDKNKAKLVFVPSSQINSEIYKDLIKEGKENLKNLLIKSAEKKKKTITCVKGIKVKKIISVNPKCPKGYKKK